MIREPFPVDSRRASRFIAVLLFLMGLVLYLCGTGYAKIGELGKARYEKSSGKLIRAFSNVDKKNYADLDSAITLGKSLQFTGALVGGGSILCWIYPGLLSFLWLGASRRSK